MGKSADRILLDRYRAEQQANTMTRLCLCCRDKFETDQAYRLCPICRGIEIAATAEFQPLEREAA